MQDAEADGCGDSQRPDELTAPFRNLSGRLGHFAEYAFCTLQEGATVFSQHQLTRGTMHHRRAASLIEPASGVVTKASSESSFSIVRLSRTLVPLIAV